MAPSDWRPSRRDFLAAAALGWAGSRLGAEEERDGPARWPEMAAILRGLRPPAIPPRSASVTDFGAKGDGQTDARPAFRAAIAHANEAGGGRITVPSGAWRLDGPLHLLSGVELNLAADATLRFTPDPALYLPAVLTRFEGTEVFNYSPCIYAYQAANIALTGRGTIDGCGAEICADWRKKQGPDRDRLRRMGAAGVPVQERIFGAGHWLRFGLVQFFGCTQVLVEDVAILRSPFWCVHAVGCSHVTVRRLRVDCPLLNNDGFDPESSSDVLIEDCTLRSGDDCIAIKSGRDQDGWRIGRPSERIVIRNCELSSRGAAAVAIGSEMSGGVRGVYVENCRVGTAGPALDFKGNLDRGGVVERVRVTGLHADSVDRLVEFTTGYQGLLGGNHPPRFRDFELTSLSCRRAKTAIFAAGAPGAELADIRLRDIAVERADRALQLAYASGLTFDRVVVNGQPIKS